MSNPARHPNESATTMTELVLPQHTNAFGTCFGGTILSWIDIAAGVCAGRHARNVAVTVAFDDVHFITPVRLGDIVSIEARLCYTGKTSMEIEVQVFRQRYDGPREHANTAYVVFVSVDAQGRPQPVAPVLIDNEADQRRADQAKARKQARLAKRAQ